jgi:hypothetical protein
MITCDKITGEVAEDLLIKIESSNIPYSKQLTSALAIISYGGENRFESNLSLFAELVEILLEIDCG